MSLKNGRYQSEPDEIGQQVAHGRTARPAILAALVQREAILLLQYIQQVLFLLRKGQECPFLLLGVLPHLQMYGSGADKRKVTVSDQSNARRCSEIRCVATGEIHPSDG